MINFDQHNASELLTLYLDGELNEEQSIQFEKILTNDPELQLEMQEQLKIREAINNDQDSFTTPAAATTAVFGALGIDQVVLSGTTGSALSGGFLSGILDSKLAIPIIATISTAIVSITTLVVLNDDANSDKQIPENTINESLLTLSTNNQNDNIKTEKTHSELTLNKDSESSHLNSSDYSHNASINEENTDADKVNFETPNEISSQGDLYNKPVISKPTHEIEQTLNSQNLISVLLSENHRNNLSLNFTSNDKESFLLNKFRSPNSRFNEWRTNRVYLSNSGFNQNLILSYSYNDLWVPYLVDYVRGDVIVEFANSGNLGGALLMGKRISSIFGVRPIVEYGVGNNSFGTFAQFNGGFELPLPINSFDLQIKWAERININSQTNTNLSGLELGIIYKLK